MDSLNIWSQKEINNQAIRNKLIPKKKAPTVRANVPIIYKIEIKILPFWINSKISTLKEEKVVKPPKNPIVMNILRLSEILILSAK